MANRSFIKLKAKRKVVIVTENNVENLILVYATIKFNYYFKEQFYEDYLYFSFIKPSINPNCKLDSQVSVRKTIISNELILSIQSDTLDENTF